MSFVSALKHFGTILLEGLHIAEKVDEIALPFLQTAFPTIGSLDAMILQSAVSIEAAGQQAAGQGSNGAQKAAAVVAAIGPQVVTQLGTLGIHVDTTVAAAYIDDIVKAFNKLPAPTTPPPAPVAIPAAPTT